MNQQQIREAVKRQPETFREWWNERSAIFEFDAGMARADAEREAYQRAVLIFGEAT